MALSEHLGVITYSPLASGLLTGKYAGDSKGSEGRITRNKLVKMRYNNTAYFDIASKLNSFAKEVNVHPATLAVSWIRTNPAVTAPIIGARNVSQLEPSLAAVEFKMTPELRTEISKLSIQPPNAIDRLEVDIDPNLSFRNR